MVNIFKKNWLVNKLSKEALALALKEYSTGRLLDIGCGEKPYEEISKYYCIEHVGMDHAETPHLKSRIDLFGTAYKIPVSDESYDSVLCTAVLEHLEDPGAAIKEMGRVLKQGGKAIYTVPLFWHLHEEPRDFYRFTKYGLKYLFEKNGFETVELRPLSGFWVTFGQEFVYYIWRFRKGGKINPLWWFIPFMGALIQGVCYAMNKVDDSKEFTWMYLAVARKI